MIKCLSKVTRTVTSPLYRFSKLQKSTQYSVEIEGQISKPPLIRTKKSIIIDDVPSHYPELTLADKKQLKLFIPTPPFNPRLSITDQQAYLPVITSQLYNLQAQLFTPQIKILESESDTNLNKYLNLIYKDVYARYLVSKGIGIDWEGRYPHLGVMNSHEHQGLNPYWLFIEALQQGKLYVSKNPTVVSLKTLVEHNIDDCNSETIKRIGHYVKYPLVGFGKYKQQFETIKERGGKIEMVGLISQLWKSTQTQAISLIQKLKYALLRKEDTDDYIITSIEHYQINKTYFTKSSYIKHSVVDSLHFQGMIAENPLGKKIPIVIQEYKRGKGNQIYTLCPAHTLADNEVAVAFGVEVISTVTQQGTLTINQEQIKIDDPALESKVSDYLKSKQRLVENLNDIVEDTLLLSSSGQVLYLILMQKLFLRIAQEERHQIINELQNECSIEESKVVLPRPDPSVPLRGRFRRAFTKEYLGVKDQQTDYYSLEQSLKLDRISISSNNNKSYPIVVNTKKSKVIISDKNLNRIKEMSRENSINQQNLQELKEPFAQQKLFYLNDNFIKSARILTLNSVESKPVAIQPQTSTEGLLQYYLHLIASLKIPFKLSMIKLHPTLKETAENLAIQTLIAGATKSNDMRQYGWGFEAVRAWVAKMDSHKGDRDITQTAVNAEQPHCASIRKTFWKILSILNKISPQKLQEIRQSTPTLPWFDQLMMDHIDFYILHMEKAYKRLDLSAAYELTLQFFQKYIEQIYVQSVRKSMINYYKQDSKLLVLERILHLVGVISPMLPFTAYHISKVQLHQWPKLQQYTNFNKIETYNQMILIRTRIKNKLSLNRMNNCTIYLEGEVTSNATEDQIALLFGVNQVLFIQPNKKQRFTIKEGKYIIRAYDYETCYRCDPKLGNKEHLCKLCSEYLLL